MANRRGTLPETVDHTRELKDKAARYLTREAAAFLWPWEICILVATIEKRKTEGWSGRGESHD